MPLTRMLPWILTAIVASIATIVTGVQSGIPILSWMAAGLFGVVLVATALDVNRTWWSDPAAAIAPDAPVIAALRNARVLILGYLWGALALIAIYRLTGVRWQHGLQYAAAMIVIAAMILGYVHLLSKPGSRLRSPRAIAIVTQLSLLHGAAALAAIFFLIVTGKIFSLKGDWPANQIFLAGGIAIAALSVIGAFTQTRLAQSRAHRDAPSATIGS